MRILSYTALLAAACLLLPACSNEDEVMDHDSPSLDAMVGDSEVEIKLSSTASATRASINGNSYGAFDVNGVGIFCVAKGKQNPEINPPTPDIDWTRYGEYGKTDVLLSNLRANAVASPKPVEKQTELGDTLETSIVWEDAEAHYFYPISNWYKYDFYGYYPVQDDANVIISPDEINVYMEIDGTQDVLLGLATSDDEYAYSAKYFRTAEHEVPNMLFFHRLSRFTFTVEAGMDYTGSKANATRMKVSKIEVLDMPYKILMTVASNTDTYGGIYYDRDFVMDFKLRDENNEPFEPVQVSETERRQVGESLMVLHGMDTYGLRITLEDENGNEYISEFPLSISNHIEEGTTQLGHSYNINMTVYGPQEIKLNATLLPWIIEETDIPIEL